MCRRSRRSEKIPTVAISRPSSSTTSAAEIDTGTFWPSAAMQMPAHRLEPAAAAVFGGADEAHDLARDARRIQLAHRHASDDVARLVAADPLGALVEQQDRPAHVGGDDPVDGGVQDPVQELARAPQLAIQLARQRHVAKREDRRVVFGQDADRRDRNRDAIARRRHQLEVEVVDRLARDGAADLAFQHRAKRLGHDLDERLAGEAVARVARHLLGGAVQVQHGARAVEDDDAVRRAVDEIAVALDGAHAAFLADVGQRDAPRTLADRFERAGAAQHDAEQRRRQPSQAERPDSAVAAAPSPAKRASSAPAGLRPMITG